MTAPGTAVPINPAAAILLWQNLGEYAEAERLIRADERRRICEAIEVASSHKHGELLALHRAMKNDPNLRREAGLLVHTLVQILDAGLRTDVEPGEQSGARTGLTASRPVARHRAGRDLLPEPA